MKTSSIRIKIEKEIPSKSQNIIYWMSRDQRVHDNWALYHAYELSVKNKSNLIVAFVIQDEYLGANSDIFKFMTNGLIEVSKKLKQLNIPFSVYKGDHEIIFKELLKSHSFNTVVTDFSPLNIKESWLKKIKKLPMNIYSVDTHNLIPVWHASDKQEYSAYTFRRKLLKKVSDFSNLPPRIEQLDQKFEDNIFKNTLKLEKKKHRYNFKSGEEQAKKTLKNFLNNKIDNYSEKRNNPNFDATSNLSPYLHFGQIYIGRIIEDLGPLYEEYLDGFVEEVLVRRELSDNYCYHNNQYKSLDGLPDWAQKTLQEHKNDPREYIYNSEEFESSNTHDKAWNAAQTEMMRTGTMHGYMRMYWAKKILEWTEDPQTAIDYAIYLNDKYSIDGRDPNGYVGILWSIGGLHDRAWAEREVYGKVRYMNYNGLKRKFDIEKYENDQLQKD